jgi:hypothetical protein
LESVIPDGKSQSFTQVSSCHSKESSEELALRPGQELIVYVLGGSIHFSKPRSIKELRGIAKGMKWKDDYRDRNDRF